MPNTIIIRNGTAAPASGTGFSVGEPAFDRSAGKLYIKNAAGSMVEIGAGATIADGSLTRAKLANDARGVGYASTLLFG